MWETFGMIMDLERDGEKQGVSWIEGGAVVKVLDPRSRGLGFNSCSAGHV